MAGKDSDVVVERLREQDRLAEIEGKLREAVATFYDPRGKMDEAFTREIPASQRGDKAAHVANYLGMWQKQARIVSDFVGIPDPDRETLISESQNLKGIADKLYLRVEELIETIPPDGPPDDLEPSRNDVACFAASRIMREVSYQQKNLGDQISDPEAKKYLLDKETLSGLQRGVSLCRNRWPSGVAPDVRSIYRLVALRRINARAGGSSFGTACWGTPSKYILDKLHDKSLPGYNEDRAERFEDVLRNSDLAKTLDRWPRRKWEDTYGLAWQLVAKLRSHKRMMQELLANTPYSELMEFTLDAITDEVVANFLISAET